MHSHAPRCDLGSDCNDGMLLVVRSGGGGGAGIGGGSYSFMK